MIFMLLHSFSILFYCNHDLVEPIFFLYLIEYYFNSYRKVRTKFLCMSYSNYFVVLMCNIIINILFDINNLRKFILI